MLLHTPSDEELYAALVNRDPAYDGRYYVGVTSTGIFCRLTCPARKPLAKNCQFFETPGACMEAGFRPCKRCSPLKPAAEADPTIRRLLTALEDDPERVWREADIVAMGLDPSTVRRAFKRQYGTTFLDMARMTRMRGGMKRLVEGAKVIDAQLEAGFESPSGFRTAFAKLLGVAPGSFTGDELLKADWIDTPLGPMIAVCDAHNLHLLEFVERKGLANELQRFSKASPGGIGIGRTSITDQIEDELKVFFAGESNGFQTPVAMHGTPFFRDVWRELQKIPHGQTRSYKDIAEAVGRPTAMRAVARANGSNQIAIVIPCHRVIGADGSLTGYAGGLWRKQKLIDLEQEYARKANS